jgi:phenylalanyl-tRNA synthetase beta chain
MGKVGRGSMDRRRPAQADETFFWLKGIAEQLFLSQHIDDVKFLPCDQPAMQAGTAVRVVAGDVEIGCIGLLRNDLRNNWRLAEPVALAELRLAAVTAQGGRVAAVHAVPSFPGVKRDMAIVVEASVGHAAIEDVIRASAPKELTTLTLFDIFQGEGIGSGRKSMAYSLTYRSSTRTLTDEEANGLHEGIKAALKQRLNVDIREG